jgi:hypothetical protein
MNGKGLLGLCLMACSADPRPTDEDTAPSCPALVADIDDDPSAWPGASTATPAVGEPTFLIPSEGLPVETQASNNNVALTRASGRWFVAWRTAPTHFASAQSAMHVMSSADEGVTWDLEATFALGTDVREPAFLLEDGVLSLSFFEAGTNPFAFEPIAVWRAQRCDVGDWSAASISEGEKVPWDIKRRGGRWLRTAYSGDHYGDGSLSLHFETTDDAGVTWTPLGQDPVSTGGDSEAAFEIAADGTLWAVTRNEDGDATGQGSKLCSAPASDWSDWTCSSVSDPERYDSPELIRHGETLYLLARRDVGGPFGADEGLVPYSLRPKRSALYRIDTQARAVVWLQDLPGVGDTAFASAIRTGPDSFRFANYTSPLELPDVSWLEAQSSPRGTQIYWADLRFEAP